MDELPADGATQGRIGVVGVVVPFVAVLKDAGENIRRPPVVIHPMRTFTGSVQRQRRLRRLMAVVRPRGAIPAGDIPAGTQRPRRETPEGPHDGS